MIVSRVYAPKRIESFSDIHLDEQKEDPGFFDGAGDALVSGATSGMKETGSALAGIASASMGTDVGRSVLDFVGVDDKALITAIDEKAKEWRSDAREDEPDPERSGIAANILYGVANGFTKFGAAMGASVPAFMLGGPVVGGATAAVGFGSVMGVNRSQTLKDQGVDEETANKAGVVSGVTNAVWSVVPGAVGARTAVRAVTGAALSTVGAVNETAIIEEILQNADYDKVAEQFDPSDPVSAATSAVLGGVVGAVTRPYAYKGKNGKDVSTRVEDSARFMAVTNADASGLPVKTEDASAMAAARRAQRKTTQSFSEGTSVRVDPSAVDEARMEEIRKASMAKMAARQAEGGSVLQNRDRSSKESVAQMNAIAGAPDYLRVATSRSLSDGAPVVTSVPSIPDIQLGREETIVDSHGVRYPVRYAVVESDSVVTSNAIDGRPNDLYGIDQDEHPVAIAGNGRVTGLNAGYDRGTMGAYRKEFAADAASHGIRSDVIEAMNRPILVRLIDKKILPQDIGDRSNTRSTQAMSMVEQAMTDANRIDLSALSFTDDGNLSVDAVVQFVRMLPQSEAAELSRNGVPTEAAWRRIDAAIFQAAYGNPELTSLLDSSSAPAGIQTVLRAYRAMAPRMLDLDGAGQLDFRQALADVLNEIQAARIKDRRITLEEIASQASMSRSPEAQVFLDFFAKNAGEKGGMRGIVSSFSQLAEFSKQNKEMVEMGAGLFGEAPVPRRADLMLEFGRITGMKIDDMQFEDVSTLADVARLETRARVESDARALGADDDAVRAAAIAQEVVSQKADMEAAQGLGTSIFEEDIERAVALRAIEDDPNLRIQFDDEDGSMSAAEFLRQEEARAEELEKMANDGVRPAVACVIQNKGV